MSGDKAFEILSPKFIHNESNKFRYEGFSFSFFDFTIDLIEMSEGDGIEIVGLTMVDDIVLDIDSSETLDYFAFLISSEITAKYGQPFAEHEGSLKMIRWKKGEDVNITLFSDWDGKQLYITYELYDPEASGF